MIVEVCANSLESALNAQKSGADRIELCSELGVGGITPSYGVLKMARQHIAIPVHVLIRPRSGDFTYSDIEFEIMKRNIELCVELGFDGIVSGVLFADGTLDVERTKELLRISAALKFTFHRAFDWVKNPLETLRQLEGIGVDTILTSGQQKSAFEGLDLLSELHHRTSKITIMPGSGISPDNVHHFISGGFRAVHLSGSKFEKRIDTTPKVSMNSPSFLKDDAIAITDGSIIGRVVDSVKTNSN